MLTNPSRLETVVRNIDDLPTLPRTVLKITERINNPKSSARDLANVITDDQVLTARLLKLVNSSFYGFPHRITTVTGAIVLLGFDAIRNLLLSTSVFELFTGRKKDLQTQREALWDHSLGTAVTAKAIGRRIGSDRIEEIFVCGLLHDIGKIVQMLYMQEHYHELIGAAHDSGIPFIQAEERWAAWTHADVGKLLATRWNLPPVVVETIKNHHHPLSDNQFPIESGVVHAADMISHALCFGKEHREKVPALCLKTWDRLGLPLQDIEPIMCEAETDFHDMSGLSETANDTELDTPTESHG